MTRLGIAAVAVAILALWRRQLAYERAVTAAVEQTVGQVEQAFSEWRRWGDRLVQQIRRAR